MADLNHLNTRYLRVSWASSHVLHIQLNKPPVNAFDEPFWRGYGSIFDEVKSGSAGDVRAMVVSSAVEKHFTAGLDLADASKTLVPPASLDPARRAIHLRTHVADFQHAISGPERCGVPVIAALHGTVFGLGVDISLACDVRYAAESAQFSIKEVDVGLAADIGTLARLRHAIGSSSAFHELAYTARTFTATEAHSIGLVSRVVDGGRDAVVREALKLAEVIASKSSVAVATTKTYLLHARDHTVSDALDYTATWNAAMLQAKDTQDAMNAFLKKAKPSFAPLQPEKAKL